MQIIGLCICNYNVSLMNLSNWDGIEDIKFHSNYCCRISWFDKKHGGRRPLILLNGHREGDIKVQ